MVRVLELTDQIRAIRSELDEAIRGVIDSGVFILGPNVVGFEEELATYCQVSHAIGVANGTDALVLTLRALGIGPGDEVAVPAFTFFASASCAWLVGARLRFVDIEPDTYCMAPRSLERVLDQHPVKGVIAVHLFGHPGPLTSIRSLADQAGIPVVEDAAQAIGASQDGALVGRFGAAACLSFFPSKNLGAFGDGGAVLTNDETLADKVRLLRVHGMRPRYYHQEVGYNSRLDELQAAVLRVKLRHLDDWTEARRTRAHRYNQLLCALHMDGLVELPTERPGCRHVYHQYTIRVSSRDRVRRHLSERGVETAIHYPLPLHLQEAFRELGYRTGDFPVSEIAAEQALSLPMYPELLEEDQVIVAEELASITREVVSR